MKREIDEELRFHLEQRTAENLAAGMSPEQAAREARKRFGNVQSIREECRSHKGASFGETLWQDVRFGLRMLRKNPGITLAVIVTLALGISINSTVFSLVNAVLFRPLPGVQHPEQLMALSVAGREADRDAFSYPEFEMLRLHADGFGEWFTFLSQPVSWQRDRKQRLFAEIVSAGCFKILGVKAAAGRTFVPSEDTAPGAHPVVVISHALWRREFNSDPNIVGTTMQLNETDYTIVGVAESRFEGVRPSPPCDVWLPVTMLRRIQNYPGALSGDNVNLHIIGRVDPATSLQAVASRVQAMLPAWEEATRLHAGKLTRGKVQLNPCGYGSISRKARAQAWLASALFLSVTVIVLVMVCVNVANMLLARALARRREIATRLALGASRGDLIRQLLAENLPLALLGGLAGLLLTHWTLDWLMAIRPAGVKIPREFGVDYRVFIFTIALSLLTTFVFGLFPALQATKFDVFLSLKDEPGQLGGRSRRFSLRNFLLAGQVSLCVLLLSSAGLLVRSLWKTQASDVGFDVQHTLLVPLSASANLAGDVTRLAAFHQQLCEDIRALPGVESVSSVSSPQLGNVSVVINVTAADGTELQANYFAVGPDYFKTLGIPLLRGREFVATDQPGTPAVVVVNEALARKMWKGGEALGQIVHAGGTTPSEVCGVVPTSKCADPREAPQPAIYACCQQSPPGDLTLLVRTRGQPAGLLRAIAAKVHSRDPTMPLAGMETYARKLRNLLAPERSVSWLFGVAGAAGLVLACVGLFGVVSYTVRQRTPELGLRMALGAQRAGVILLVMRETVLITVAGLVAGTLLAVGSARLLAAVHHGIAAPDVATFVVVPLLVGIVVGAACLIPAWRAARLNPMTALRHE